LIRYALFSIICPFPGHYFCVFIACNEFRVPGKIPIFQLTPEDEFIAESLELLQVVSNQWVLCGSDAIHWPGGF
jgi:hypothetical protein